ncbi:MAG TPA: hypothetical protein VNA20_07135 [Frankiaceae bacterium]|nr:hypothetical protein [Frankiaceae bacterium]
MKSRHMIAAVAAVALAGSVGVADAAPKKKPKPINGSKKVTDTTPDPTASDPNSGAGCDTMIPQLPREAPVPIKIPGPGKLKVSIDNKLDWAIEIIDPKGRVIAAEDGGTPEVMESTTAKTKTAGTYKMLACNLGGEPEVTMKWTWTPA